MRYLILCISIVSFFQTKAQIAVPKNFKLVKGESPVGRDDYFTDGKYILFEGTPFQANMPSTDAGIKEQLFQEYDIRFNKTKDGLFYATGFSRNKFRYIVIAGGFSFDLASKENNSGFSNYSVWLLGAIRTAIRGGNELYFK